MPPTAQLLSYANPRELWADALPAWLEENARLRRPGAPPAVVLAPEVTRLGWIKKTWLEGGGCPLLGIEFWTPGKLRRYLLDRLQPETKLATAEDLALILRLVLKDEPDDSPLGVIGQNPTAFLFAWDTWMAARADRVLFAAPWRALPKRLDQALKKLGLESVRSVDATLASSPLGGPTLLGPLLIDGFSSLHASLYPLLTAAIRQAESSLFTCPLPRERRLEHVWTGTFEAVMQTSAELLPPLEHVPPFASWAERAERGVVADDCPENVSFRLFETRSGEITTLADRVGKLFATTENACIGVVLPPEPYLIRRLAGQLVAAGIPLHDSFGYFPTGTDAEDLFAAWVAFQRTGQLIEGDAFVEALTNSGDLSALEAKRIRTAWKIARERTLSDDLHLLTAYLSLEGDHLPGQPAALDWAAAWPRLPGSASIALFLEISAPAFAAWDDALSFEEARKNWETTWARYPENIERARFLEWLWESLRRPGRMRHPSARDAFAPVQLIAYEMVGSGTWSHLLLAGLNERLVPAPNRETAFLLPEAAHRHLVANIIEGPQGEGHEILRPDSGFLLEDNARRALLSGTLFDAIAATTHRIELFATYAPEGTDRSATVLSEFYQRLYRAAKGREAAFPAPEKIPARDSESKTNVSTLSIRATGEAYAHRFDPETPFDAYSFSYSESPERPLTFGARHWEAVLKRPATVWLERIAHLRPRDNFSEPVQLALMRGSAVHRLLRLCGGQTWRSLDDSATGWADRVRLQSQQWRHLSEQASKRAGTALSPLWHEQWGVAQQQALNLADLVSNTFQELSLATEYPLPEGARWTAADGASISLSGRIDALLVDHPEHPGAVWVIDFKTGGDSALKQKKLSDGEGLQLVLYGGALSDVWQCRVNLTLVKPGDQSIEAQLALGPGEDPSGTLAGLARIGRTGRVGFAGRLRSEYAYVGDYPIAFIAPPSEIVASKWIQTHPNLKLPKGTED